MNKTIEYYVNLIIPHLSKLKDNNGKELYGNRSHLRHILLRMIEDPELQHKAATRAVELVANAIRGGKAAGGVAMNLGKSVGYISGYSPADPPPVTEKGILAMGIAILDWFAEEGLITMQKLNMDNTKHYQWFILPRGDFASMCVKLSTDTRYPALIDGPFIWEKPVAMFNDHPLELVKKSIRAKMVGYYTEDKIPEVYQAVNTCNRQSWKINPHIINLARTATGDNPFLPNYVSADQLTEAREALMKLKFKASYYKKFIAREVLDDSGLDEATIEKIATNKTKVMVKEKSADQNEVMSEFDQQRLFYRIFEIAKNVEGKELNFTYSFDSRGRMYAMQPNLQPLGSDFAKGMLCYHEEYPVELYDLAICTANLMGEDKVPFAERVEYVNNNMDLIRDLGSNPWAHMDKLNALELGDSDKWQALAIFNVWHKYHEWIEAGYKSEDFTTSVPICYDGSNQGLQILSLIGRDEFCGPMVNVAPHTDENGDEAVGDIYAYCGDFLPEQLKSVPKDKLTDTLKAFINFVSKPENASKRRKVVKRNVMTRSYACTRFGCGEQQLEDRKSYGFDEAMELTPSDCFTLGGAIWDITKDRLGNSAGLMDWLQQGIATVPEDDPVVKWVLPDGFTAFTYKEKTKQTSATGMIGKQSVTLACHIGTGKVDKRKQKSAIAPSTVHSLDAYVLRKTVRDMPVHAPFSAVHDSFGTASCYGAELVEVVREAYTEIADRDYFEQMMSKCFSDEVKLPEPGKLTLEDLAATDYFIS